MGFPDGSDGKESDCNTRDLGSIPGLGSSPGEGNGSPLQYSGLENSMDRGVWWATVHGASKSRTGLTNQHNCIRFSRETEPTGDTHTYICLPRSIK